MLSKEMSNSYTHVHYKKYTPYSSVEVDYRLHSKVAFLKQKDWLHDFLEEMSVFHMVWDWREHSRESLQL